MGSHKGRTEGYNHISHTASHLSFESFVSEFKFHFSLYLFFFLINIPEKKQKGKNKRNKKKKKKFSIIKNEFIWVKKSSSISTRRAILLLDRSTHHFSHTFQSFTGCKLFYGVLIHLSFKIKLNHPQGSNHIS